MFRKSAIIIGLILVVCVPHIKLYAGEEVKVDIIVPHKIEPAKSTPMQMNYQGWLGSATDTAGITDTLDMILRIYTTPTGGTPMWNETHIAVVVDKGIFNIYLGETTPLPTYMFSGNPLWLEVQVAMDTLMPRKKLVSVGYSIRAQMADSAVIASNSYKWSDNVWGTEVPQANKADTADYVAGANVVGEVAQANRADTATYALGGGGARYADTAGIAIRLQPPETLVVNASYAPLYLRNNGPGKGLHILRSIDGVYVDSAMGGGEGFEVRHADGNGVEVGYAGFDGVFVDSAGDDGVQVSSAGDDGVSVNRAGHDGFYVNSAGHDGVYVYDAGTHGVAVEYAGWDGVAVGNAGDAGVYVISADNAGVYASGDKYGGVFYNDTTGGYPTLRLQNNGGASSDGNTANDRLAYFFGGTTLRFYFRGDGAAYADAGWNTFKQGGKGDVLPYHSVQSRDMEIVASGSANLQNGIATVILDSEISEFISGDIDLRITLTSNGSWSGLYVAQRSKGSFVVKSGAGDPNAEFDWIVIAREKGYEQRTELSAEEVDEILHPKMLERERPAKEHQMKRNIDEE